MLYHCGVLNHSRTLHNVKQVFHSVLHRKCYHFHTEFPRLYNNLVLILLKHADTKLVAMQLVHTVENMSTENERFHVINKQE